MEIINENNKFVNDISSGEKKLNLIFEYLYGISFLTKGKTFFFYLNFPPYCSN